MPDISEETATEPGADWLTDGTYRGEEPEEVNSRPRRRPDYQTVMQTCSACE